MSQYYYTLFINPSPVPPTEVGSMLINSTIPTLLSITNLSFDGISVFPLNGNFDLFGIGSQLSLPLTNVSNGKLFGTITINLLTEDTSGGYYTQYAVVSSSFESVPEDNIPLQVTFSVVGGSAGPQGPTGPAGATAIGMTGFTGIIGDTGPQGAITSGFTGPQGLLGVQGPTGIQGATGIQGVTGHTGPTSSTPGGTGATGSTGPAGITGLTGIAGAIGLQGPTGSSGIAGNAGPLGPTGAISFTGPIGPTGVTGTNGSTGPTGISVTGPTGPTGSSAGVAGPSGLTGPAGTSATGPPPNPSLPMLLITGNASGGSISFTPQARTRVFIFELWGGGGGGGSAFAGVAGPGGAAGGGGGGGGYCKKTLTRDQILAVTTFPLTIQTTFSAGALSIAIAALGLSATGGLAGSNMSVSTSTAIAPGGAGGTASGGDINISGAAGNPGILYFNGGLPFAIGGRGGACPVYTGGRSPQPRIANSVLDNSIVPPGSNWGSGTSGSCTARNSGTVFNANGGGGSSPGYMITELMF